MTLFSCVTMPRECTNPASILCCITVTTDHTMHSGASMYNTQEVLGSVQPVLCLLVREFFCSGGGDRSQVGSVLWSCGGLMLTGGESPFTDEALKA